MNVLILNSGSSSIKYQLFDAREARALATGAIEKIGEPGGSVPDARAGFARVLETLKKGGWLRDAENLLGIGHRVVHGGKYENPELIDDAVISEIRKMIPLAPLHNGPNLA